MALDQAAQDSLFALARTHNKWDGSAVSDDDLRAIYHLAKWGPTSANSSPARFVFLRTAEAKEKLRPALSAGNLDKTAERPGGGHRRLRSEILRPAAAAVPACRRPQLVRQQRGAGRGDCLPQQQPAGAPI